MNSERKSYDVLILGAGVAGCATAIALKNRMPDLQVGMLDRKSSSEVSAEGYVHIGETLSAHAAQPLRRLGLWEVFSNQKFPRSFGTSSAWGSDDLHQNEFIYSPYGYGWHLDRPAFDRMMVAQAGQRGVAVHWGTALSSFASVDEHWEMTGSNAHGSVRYTASIVVDATGHKAAFAVKQGVSKKMLDKLVAIYQFFALNDNDENYKQGTYVESDESGWWYSATLPGRQLVIAYFTDADIATQLKLKNPLAFTARMQQSQYTNSRLSDTKPLSAPQLAPAHSQILERKTGRNWIAVGDAAMSFDPLSSMGIFKALSTSLYAGYAVEDELKGIKTGFLKYEKIMSGLFNGYCTQRVKHYTEEGRYGAHPFWSRRHLTASHINQQSINQPKNETVKAF